MNLAVVLVKRAIGLELTPSEIRSEQARERRHQAGEDELDDTESSDAPELSSIAAT